MIFSSYHQSFLRALVHAGVKFLIAGGHAAIYYGVRRNTGDMDILIGQDEENGKRLLQAFKQMKVESDEINPEEFKGEIFLSLGFDPDAIDIMTRTRGIDFDDAWSRSVEMNADGITVRILGIDDLISNKESLNREGPKGLLDRADAETLKSIRKKRN